MTMRSLLLVGVAACGFAAAPASAQVVCDGYGNCYQNYGGPTYAPYAYGYGYGDYGPHRRHDWRFWRYWGHHHRHYDDNDESTD